MCPDRKKTDRPVRRGRRKMKGVSDTPTIPAPAFLKRTVPPYEIISEEGLQRIEDEADRLLAEIGIEFRGNPAPLRPLSSFKEP